MIRRFFSYITILTLSCCMLTSCSSEDDDQRTVCPEPETDMSGFAKGADVSWITEMEKSGVEFYNASGRKQECLSLLKSLGMNSVRLRVWVNPTDGWCGKSDFLAKAYRANLLGMRIMVDFHYSDSWADPSQQTKPKAWAGYSLEQLEEAVAAHTTDVLSALRETGITPEWVQVGNETGNGMLWDEGRASDNMAAYASLNNAGYDAVKSIFPDAKVIVHLQEGDRNSLYRWLFDGLKNNGGKWDVIGMSLYPEASTYVSLTNDCLANIEDMISRYSCEVMICEVGMNNDEATACNQWLTMLIDGAGKFDKCLGVFYWEPQSFQQWNGYGKGAFDDNGMPTEALDPFSR